jgi:hypothetical protein
VIVNMSCLPHGQELEGFSSEHGLALKEHVENAANAFLCIRPLGLRGKRASSGVHHVSSSLSEIPRSRQTYSTVFCPILPFRRMAMICSSINRVFITALSGPRFYHPAGHFRGAGHHHFSAVILSVNLPNLK